MLEHPLKIYLTQPMFAGRALVLPATMSTMGYLRSAGIHILVHRCVLAHKPYQLTIFMKLKSSLYFMNSLLYDRLA